MRTIVFYNRWHNGDLFLSKGYISRLIKSLKSQGEFKFYFAHKNNAKSLCDLDVEFISIKENDIIPANDAQTIFQQNDVIYINTWVGAYLGFFTKTQDHATIGTINTIWFSIYYALQAFINVKLFTHYYERFSPEDGIPTTDWSKFEINQANLFLSEHKKEHIKLILFCNGRCSSNQTINSNINLMEKSINLLASENPNHKFICTERIGISQEIKNVFFTDDIFAGVLGGDINEIAYLSTFCDIIVGKNSGPHMYTHVKENVNRDCIFFTVSDRQSDDYLYNCYDIRAKHIFFVGRSEDNFSMVLDRLIKEHLRPPQFCVITDTKLIRLQKTMDARNF